MAKAYEISIWKPHPGKRAEFMKGMAEVNAIFKEIGVSDVQVLEGVAGKDVGHVVVIQTFKGLADNGAINEAIGESAAMAAWNEKNKNNDYATMISHDLYSEA